MTCHLQKCTIWLGSIHDSHNSGSILNSSVEVMSVCSYLLTSIAGKVCKMMCACTVYVHRHICENVCVFPINTRMSHSMCVILPSGIAHICLFVCAPVWLCTLSAVLQCIWLTVVMWRAESWESCHFSDYLWKRWNGGGRRGRIKERREPAEGQTDGEKDGKIAV